VRAPVVAMLWEWWRMTYRQALFFGVIALAAGWSLFARSGADPRGAFVVFMLIVSLAPAGGLAAWSRNPFAGYPLPLAFARPVSTRLLVGVPMVYMAFVCAAIYAVPAIVLRVGLGAPFPVVPVAALLAASMALFCACNWFTRGTVKRLLANIALLIVGGPALRWMSPWHGAAGGAFPPPLRTDSVQLGFEHYALLALAVVAAWAATVIGVEAQRHGDDVAERGRSTPAAPGRAAQKGIVEHFRDAADAVVRIPCPTSSPLAAELWLEARSRGLPVIAMGLVLALLAPAVLAFAGKNGPIVLVSFAALAVFIPFLSGVSASIWNRASSLRAPMSAFEATRPMGTARLAAVQIGVAVAAILGAWAVIAAAVALSLPLYGGAGAAPIWRALAARPASELAGVVVLGVVGFATVIALLATVRAIGAIYGLRLWLGALAVVAYAIGLAFAVATDYLSPAAIGAHLWAVALAIPVGTAYVIVRALAARVLRAGQLLAIAAAWIALAGIAAFVARGTGTAVEALAPAVAALTWSAALLPLSAAVVAPWAYSRMRHV
jgi:hypothetical protein